MKSDEGRTTWRSANLKLCVEELDLVLTSFQTSSFERFWNTNLAILQWSQQSESNKPLRSSTMHLETPNRSHFFASFCFSGTPYLVPIGTQGFIKTNLSIIRFLSSANISGCSNWWSGRWSWKSGNKNKLQLLVASPTSTFFNRLFIWSNKSQYFTNKTRKNPTENRWKKSLSKLWV